MRPIQPSEAPASIHKKKGPSPWRLEDHICRKCFGRVVSQPTPDATLYRCTNCGYEIAGPDVSAICCCGIKYKKGGRKGSKSVAPIDAGIRCIRNPHPSAEFPCEIVASEVAYAHK